MATTRIQAEPFDIGAEYAALTANAGEAGGVGFFIGTVRAADGLVALTLEHYPGMTERALAAIAEQAKSRWALCGCTIIHRIGRLLVGQPIVLVGAASRHRQEALDATRFMIDWLKTDAPFWKSVEHADGTCHWVQERPSDNDARAAWNEEPAQVGTG